jgi:hypothetical protein
MKDQERKRVYKIYGHLYKRVSGVSWERCIYCGGPVQCWDHAPALSLVDGIDVEKYKAKGGKFRLYPACLQCNSLLHNYSDTNFYGRLEYLALRYKKRLAKIPYWSENELAGLGKNMKAFVINRSGNYDMLAEKIDTIVENIANDEYIDFE